MTYRQPTWTVEIKINTGESLGDLLERLSSIQEDHPGDWTVSGMDFHKGEINDQRDWDVVTIRLRKSKRSGVQRLLGD